VDHGFSNGMLSHRTNPTATKLFNQTYWTQTCGTFILSNGTPREHEGIAASLINTVANYSVSTSLGIAGTIFRETDNRGGNVLGSYRNVWYIAIGLDSLGMAIALYSL
jgi:hypothetical protein